MKWMHGGCNLLFKWLNELWRSDISAFFPLPWVAHGADAPFRAAFMWTSELLFNLTVPFCQLKGPHLGRLWPVKGNCKLSVSFPPPYSGLRSLHLSKPSTSQLLSSTRRAWRCRRCVRRTTSCKRLGGCSLVSAAETRMEWDETS